LGVARACCPVRGADQRWRCRKTPGTIKNAGFALLAVAAAIVFVVPDDSGALIALQGVLALALGGGALAALAGGSILGALQRD